MKIGQAIILGAAFCAVFFVSANVHAAISNSDLQAQIDADNQQIISLNQQIAVYQAKLKQIGSDKKTLQAAINALDLQRNKVQAQVLVTQRQINTTQLQITQLAAQILDAEQSIASNQAALGAYLRDLQDKNQPLVMQLLSAKSLAQIWDDLNSNRQIEGTIQQKTQELQVQKTNLSDNQTALQAKQTTLTSQKKSLASQQQSLNATVQAKSQLLAETKAQESSYQKLLAAAQAQLKSFSDFVKNAGGAALLPNQTVCDSWGCYYNQRDSSWGTNSLNGTQFTLAGDGCLVTSMAMMMTHYGYKNVTPVSINSNPDNFASYYPAYLLFTINVGGVSATRIASAIDATLSTGNPVVVGLRAYGGTHFVVLTSGSNGSYLMNDPYIANGKGLSFSSKYSVANIFSIAKVVINN